MAFIKTITLVKNGEEVEVTYKKITNQNWEISKGKTVIGKGNRYQRNKWLVTSSKTGEEYKGHHLEQAVLSLFYAEN